MIVVFNPQRVSVAAKAPSVSVEAKAMSPNYVGQGIERLGETTYTPSNAVQTIQAGQFLEGDQIISAVAPPFYDMSNEMSCLGKGVELLNGSLYSRTDKLKNTSFKGWTPSTTAKTLVASATAGTFEADTANYDYYIIWECGCDPVYTGTPALTAHTLLSRAYLVQEVFKRPSSWANVQADLFNGNATAAINNTTFLRYYGTTVGSVTYSWGVSYGFYFAVTAPTFSNSTSDTPTVNIKTPTFSARCSTTYMSTANAGLVDQDKSEFFIRGKLYRVKSDGILRGVYNKVVDLINE